MDHVTFGSHVWFLRSQQQPPAGPRSADAEVHWPNPTDAGRYSPTVPTPRIAGATWSKMLGPTGFVGVRQLVTRVSLLR